MTKEKFSDSQKKSMAKLNPTGKTVDLISAITQVSKSTIYKAKREGALLNRVDKAEKEKRELDVQIQMLKTLISQTQKKSKKVRKHK